MSALTREKSIYYVGEHGNFTWPRRELAVSIDGDIVLGALHMVHERSEDLTCGPIMSQGGVQSLETMLYTLDYINNRQDILPGVKLGMLAKDDCDRDIYGLEQAVDFIRGKKEHALYIFNAFKAFLKNSKSPLVTFSVSPKGVSSKAASSQSSLL